MIYTWNQTAYGFYHYHLHNTRHGSKSRSHGAENKENLS